MFKTVRKRILQFIIIFCYLLLDNNYILAKEVNPLENNQPDPLLPQAPVPRPLSPLEKYTLKQSLDELNLQAQQQLKAGNIDIAFEIWYRELRLRKSLEKLEEIQALGRVGEAAWQNNRKTDIRIISDRLEEIYLETVEKEQLDQELLRALGLAYQQMRQPDKTIELYQQILANARDNKNKEEEISALEIIASTHLSWFHYPEASQAYETLLTITQDANKEIEYLQQLVYIYQQYSSPQKSLEAKNKLANYYLENNLLSELMILQISIAKDYDNLEDVEKAAAAYQQSFKIASQLEYLAYASESLKQLGDLYQKYDEFENALNIYQKLITSQEATYDFYGLMNTYSQMAKIYVSQKKYEQAKSALKQGLELAKSLKYDQQYFQDELAEIEKII